MQVQEMSDSLIPPREEGERGNFEVAAMEAYCFRSGGDYKELGRSMILRPKERRDGMEMERTPT